MTNEHGGKRPGAGRKSKAEELGLTALLDECFTSRQRRSVLTTLAKKAVDGDMKAIELLLAYTYGKPVQRTELSGANGAPLFKAFEASDDFDPDAA